MEFIVLRTSLAYGCMGLCCEMLNLVVLGQNTMVSMLVFTNENRKGEALL